MKLRFMRMHVSSRLIWDEAAELKACGNTHIRKFTTVKVPDMLGQPLFWRENDYYAVATSFMASPT